MRISFAAPCGKRFITDARFAGQHFACPRCRRFHSVPRQKDGHENIAGHRRTAWPRFRRASDSSLATRLDGPNDRVWPWLCAGVAALVCLGLFVFQKTEGRVAQDVNQNSKAESPNRVQAATAAVPTAPIERTPVLAKASPVDAGLPKQEPRIKVPAGAPVQIVEWYPVNDASLGNLLTLLAVRVRLAGSLVDAQEKIADYRVITSAGYAPALEGVGWNRLAVGTPLVAGAGAGNYTERGLLFVLHQDDMNSGEVYFQYRKYPPVLLSSDCMAPLASAAITTSEPARTVRRPQVNTTTLQQTNGQRPSDWPESLRSAGATEASSAAGPSDGGSSSGTSGLSVTSNGVIALNGASLFSRFPHHHWRHDRDRDRDGDEHHNQDKDKADKKSEGNSGGGPSRNGPNVFQGKAATPQVGQPLHGGPPPHDIPAFREVPGHVPFALSHDPTFRSPPMIRLSPGRRH